MFPSVLRLRLIVWKTLVSFEYELKIYFVNIDK